MYCIFKMSALLTDESSEYVLVSGGAFSSHLLAVWPQVQLLWLLSLRQSLTN